MNHLYKSCLNFVESKYENPLYEREILKWFRDGFVCKDDLNYYNEASKIILKEINSKSKKEKNIIYNNMYDSIIDMAIYYIEKKEYLNAYRKLKKGVVSLEEKCKNNSALILKRTK